MLKNINRLKKGKDFDKIFKKGRGFKENFILLKIIKNNLGLKRFGFIISQKVSKKATIRNKLKRKLRKLIEVEFNKIKEGIDGIFIALPGLENKDYQELKEIIDKILKKAKVLK